MSYLDSLTFEERLKIVVVVRHLLENSDSLDPRVMHSLRTVQRELKLERANQAKQTRITQYLVKIMSKNDLIRIVTFRAVYETSIAIEFTP